MNTINPVQSAFSPVAVARSSGASASLPGETSPDTAEARSAEAAQDLQKAGSAGATRGRQDGAALQQQLDDTLKDVQTSLRFRVDEEASRVVVSVVDRGSGDVIYQIPSDVALRIAKRMAELGSGMINESA